MYSGLKKRVDLGGIVDIKTLKLFLHLYQTLNFSRTSEACHLSPSTLSRAIKRLEDEVGEPLFHRDQRSVQPTKAGQAFFHYAQDSVQRWEKFRQSLRGNHDNLHGELSMYCSVTASYSFLAELLVRFRERYPNIDIKLRTGDAAESIPKLINGEADVVIAARPDKLSAKLSFKAMTTAPLIFIAPVVDCHALNYINTEKREFQWQDIPMILSERGLARDRVDNWFKAKGIKPKIYAQVSGNEAIASMVSLGFGVGVVPNLVVSNSALAQSIQTLSVTPQLEPFSVGICTLKRKKQDPLIAAFWRLTDNINDA